MILIKFIGGGTGEHVAPTVFYLGGGGGGGAMPPQNVGSKRWPTIEFAMISTAALCAPSA